MTWFCTGRLSQKTTALEPGGHRAAGEGHGAAHRARANGPGPTQSKPTLKTTRSRQDLLLLCFQDVAQQVWFGIVADEVGIFFAGVVVEFVGFVVVGVFY